MRQQHESKSSELPGQPGQQEEPKPLHTRLLKFLFGHVGMFILVSIVAAGGAWIFVEIETGAEERRYLLKKTRARDIEDGLEYLASDWWHFAVTPNLTYATWRKKITGNLRTMESFLLEYASDYSYDGTVDGWTYDWTFPKALLYTITIMTTIGYGHISPKTFVGQLFTIIYAMVGTPLLLVFLANIGDGMAKTFTYTYSRICCRWCRSARYKSERLPGKKAKRLADDIVGKEPYMPTDEVQVPITINLVLIMFYLLVGAIIFSEWEGWEMSAAYYFSFVTLSTIGFGDMVPGNSFLDKKDGVIAGVKMGVTIMYCLIGMALISMCIQMMQDSILDKVRWAGRELGLVAPEQQRRAVRVRRTRRGAVPETDYLADSRPPTSEKRRRRRKKREAAAEQQQQEQASKQEPLLPPPGDSDDDLFNLA